MTGWYSKTISGYSSKRFSLTVLLRKKCSMNIYISNFMAECVVSRKLIVTQPLKKFRALYSRKINYHVNKSLPLDRASVNSLKSLP
jgi:hypothetical protein